MILKERNSKGEQRHIGRPRALSNSGHLRFHDVGRATLRGSTVPLVTSVTARPHVIPYSALLDRNERNRGIYARHIGPRVVSCLCSMQDVATEREKVVPHASGTVLEIGIGPGLIWNITTRPGLPRLSASIPLPISFGSGSGDTATLRSHWTSSRRRPRRFRSMPAASTPQSLRIRSAPLTIPRARWAKCVACSRGWTHPLPRTWALPRMRASPAGRGD